MRLLCRWVDRDGVPAYSSYGVHELCIRRVGSSLQFDRLSMQTRLPKLWLAIFFKTWESQSYIHIILHWFLTHITSEMVLFHNTFVALKARCPLTVNCSPNDFVLSKERQLLQEYMQSLHYRPYNVSP